MSKMLRKIDVFISSPGDVRAEREIAARVVDRLNALAFVQQHFTLRALAYEDRVPPSVGSAPQQTVDRYMMQAKDSDLLICIFWERMGTPVYDDATGVQYESGTHYEFATAYAANQQTGKPHILLYRRMSEAPDANPDQKARVDAFFNRFEGQNAPFKGLYRQYYTLEEFEEILFQHVERLLTSAVGKIAPPPVFALKEEARRLDAAMPSSAQLRQDIEVWVQICMPDSDGFRGQLPAQTTAGDVIARKDVRAGSLGVRFPVDPATGRMQPARLRVDLSLPAGMFSFGPLFQNISLTPGRDSGLMLFRMQAEKAIQRAIVHVMVKQTLPDGEEVTVGAVALATEVTSGRFRFAAKVAWALASLPLAALPSAAPAAPLQRAESPAPVNTASDREAIEKALFLDENLLYTLLPAYPRTEETHMFNFGGQRRHGQEQFEALVPSLRKKLCEEWKLCEKLNDPLLQDEFALTAALIEVIAPVVKPYPPHLIAALIVKIGVSHFCDC
ncbi:MAG: DUF4062 domain-containing protein [Chloroflexi bacterium]|nr:DUF4062 domain-containing protein [Chloroflexota bacterium]